MALVGFSCVIFSETNRDIMPFNNAELLICYFWQDCELTEGTGLVLC